MKKRTHTTEVPETKARLHFRAMPHGNRLAIESNRGGVWTAVIVGIDEAYLNDQFERLEKRGCIIEHNQYYRKRRKVA